MRSWMIGVVAGFIVAGFMPLLFPAWLVAAVFGAGVLSCFSNRSAPRLLGGLLLATAAGSFYGEQLLEHRLTSSCEAVPLRVEGEIVSLPRRSSTRFGQWRQRFEFRVDRINPRRCQGPRRLLLSYYGEQQLHPGQIWRFSTKLKRPWGLANPGSFNIQYWYAQKTLDGTGTVKEAPLELLHDSKPRRLGFQALRGRISRRVSKLDLEEPVKGILRALVVADKSGIDAPLWALFQSYGINHLLVISGLHIGIVAGAAYLLGGVVGRLAYLCGAVRAAAIIPFILVFGFAFSYAALAGFALSTVRALCMLACFIAASLLARNSLSANNLLIAAVIILLLNPLAAIGSGFWLSFSAVACLLWLGIWRVNTRLPLRLLHTHIYMALAMIPLGGWWFGGVSQVAVLANIVLVPLVGLFIVPMALLAVVIDLLCMPLNNPLWYAAAWPIQHLLPGATDIAGRHAQALYSYLTPSPVEMVLALVALALSVTPLPARLYCLVVVLALPIFLPDDTADKNVPGPATLTILDVGQGTSVVLRSGNKTLVYDTGGGDPAGANIASHVVLPFLRARGVRRLDMLMISHQDNDHSAGADTLIKSLPVRHLITGGDSGLYAEAENCIAGRAWQWPSGVRFQILSPEADTVNSTNNSSCVLQIQVGATHILLPGDIDAARERQLVTYWRGKLGSELLLAGHHGSKTASSFAWLKTVGPSQAIFSFGYLNQFSHPHKEVLERYPLFNAVPLATATAGALEYTIQPSGAFSVHSYRAALDPYWL